MPPRSIEKGVAFKKKLRDGRRIVGCWLTLNSPECAYIMARAGLDFVVVDLEHNLGDQMGLFEQVRALERLETAVFVRVPDQAQSTFKRMLDVGVQGVVVPQVENAEEAATIVAHCLYPPAGSRGVAVNSIPAADFGFASLEYFAGANDAITIFCQIESAAAIEQIESIAAVDGVDGLFLGPSDLSASMNRFREFDDPGVAAAIEAFETKAKASGKWIGGVPHSGLQWHQLLDRGYQFVPAGSEQTLLRNGVLEMIDR